MKTQTKLVLSHLKAGKSITPIEALNDYGIFRLGARVLELRKLGYDIKTEIVGGVKNYAKYTLKEQK